MTSAPATQCKPGTTPAFEASYRPRASSTAHVESVKDTRLASCFPVLASKRVTPGIASELAFAASIRPSGEKAAEKTKDTLGEGARSILVTSRPDSTSRMRVPQ